MASNHPTACYNATFSINHSQDKKENKIADIICLLSEYLVVADYLNGILKLFTSIGRLLSSEPNPQSSTGMDVLIGDVFVTCGYDKKIYFWTVRDQKIEQLDGEIEVNLDADAIRYDGENYVVLHRMENAVTVLDNRGNHKTILKIRQAFGMTLNLGYDIELDQARKIFLPCVGESRGPGVLCMSLQGEYLWHCKLEGNVGGLVFINSLLSVVRTDIKRVHLIDCGSGTLYDDVFIGETNLHGKASKICYSQASSKLYVSFDEYGQNSENVSMFAISYM